MDKLGNNCATLLQFSPLSLGNLLPSKIVGFRASVFTEQSLLGELFPSRIVGPSLLFTNPGELSQAITFSILLSRQPCENVKAVMEHRMDSQAPTQGKEMDLDDSENQQKMFIRLCALNSTVSFALDTLAQHRILIGQLQDEVNALRRQNKDCSGGWSRARGIENNNHLPSASMHQQPQWP
jgi:hypothetical protein